MLRDAVFTPLENGADFNRLPLPLKADVGFKTPSVLSGRIKNSLAGFTLVEIIVASVIFALVIGGLLGVFVAGKKHIIHAHERMIGSELGRLFIDPLGNFVRQDTWNSNALAISGTPVILPSQIINNRTFSATYTVEDSAGDTALTGTDLRRVTTTISWTELSL